MLAKTLHIKNVGRLNSTAAVDLAQATVVYAENGRGKSTLAAVLRSLQTGEPLHILERRTIGSTDMPSVSVLTSVNAKNSTHTFDGKVWNTTLSECEIFDATFVAENVYSGSDVDPEHRWKLHKFVLGASNVALARKVDDLADEIRAATQAIADAELVLQKLCLDGLPPEQFEKAPKVSDFPAAIDAQEAVVELARGADIIARTQAFSTLQGLSVDLTELNAALGRTLADVEAEAEALVRQHIARYGSSLSEKWLFEGLQHLVAETCPMCASGIEGSVLIRAYRTYFSDAYTRLKTDIAAARTRVQGTLTTSVVDALVAAGSGNERLAPFWSSHGIQCPTAPPLAAAQTALVELRNEYDRAFNRKLGNVLDAVSVGAEVGEHEATLAATAKAILEYNAAISAANSAIGAVKRTAASNSLTAALEKLRSLRNGRARHSAEGEQAIASVKTARAHKKRLEADKKAAKEDLDNATQALFANYQDRINKHLLNCGCGYKITNTKTVYSGGKSRTDYQLEINSQTVDLASPKIGVAPSFKNTLSDGDKSALAFAFFLAKLELDPSLATKIVVLDDPMTSLDAHRRTYTCERIVKLVPDCRQVILLTHDAQFARQVWDGLPKSKKALHIEEVNGRSRIAEWDILRATRSDYFTRHDLVAGFVSSGIGDRTAIAVSLRLLLEGNLRMRFPEHFAPHEWLGDFIKKVRTATAGEYLAALQPKLYELTSVNDYAKQFHHDQNPTAALVKPVDAELKAYARRTLDLAAGLP